MINARDALSVKPPCDRDAVADPERDQYRSRRCSRQSGLAQRALMLLRNA